MELSASTIEHFQHLCSGCCNSSSSSSRTGRACLRAPKGELHQRWRQGEQCAAARVAWASARAPWAAQQEGWQQRQRSAVSLTTLSKTDTYIPSSNINSYGGTAAVAATPNYEQLRQHGGSASRSSSPFCLPSGPPGYCFTHPRQRHAQAIPVAVLSPLNYH